MGAYKLAYLRDLGLGLYPPEASFALRFAADDEPAAQGGLVVEAELLSRGPAVGPGAVAAAARGQAGGAEAPAVEEAAVRVEEGAEEEADRFEQALGDAFSSALTKFDSLEAYFANGRMVPDVASMLVEEMAQDPEISEHLAAPGRSEALLAFVRTSVGKAYGSWKKGGGWIAKKETANSEGRGVPLPWASIDAYPAWVLEQIQGCAGAAPEERDSARARLERALLEEPVLAASVKLDGTCFGKMDSGCLVGRKQVLGADCQQYQHTSTAAAGACDVAALRSALEEALGAELGQLCVWGELMCNPHFYGYQERGLAEHWVCFGVVAAFSSPDAAALSQRLSGLGLAHSVGAAQVRLLLCPALRRLLQDVAHCEVVDEPFCGLSQAEVVARGAQGLRAGDNEGIVLVFGRSNGQASLRKWKNSSEGANARQKEARRLRDCHDLCLRLASEGRLDARIAAMVDTLRSVAEAETSPLKKGKKAGVKAA